MLHFHKKNLTLKNILPYILIFVAIIGCAASLILTHEKIRVIQDSSYIPSCNINPIFSCGSVMKTEQADLMGMPNTIIGLMAFSMLFAFGLLLLSGAKFKRWVWIGAQIAALFGVIFMHYLFFQGVYVINAICPWCFVVWIITIPVFWYITVYNLKEKHLILPQRLKTLSEFIQRHHADILILWYMIIFGILLEHFWYYWSSLFQ